MRSIVFLICLCVGFYACTNDAVAPVGIENESVYDRIGRLHNEGLDYVLKKITDSSPLMKSGGCKIPPMSEIRNLCKDFAESKGYGIKTKNTRIDRLTIEDFTFLSELQQKWLHRIKEKVQTTTPKEVKKFIVEIRALEEQLRQNQEIVQSEKEILFYTMAVCRYSAHYWAENYEKWQVELYGINKSSSYALKTSREGGHYVSKEWWETYKTIVSGDGVSGIQSGDGYYLENAIEGSVAKYL